MMRFWRWLLGALVLGSIIALILLRPFPFLFYQELPHLPFVGRALYILLLACFLCLFRILRGPTGADRLVAVDLLGVMITGLCAILTISTGRTWYIDVGIAWALQSFITVLVLCKYLEGKDFDE